MGRRFCVRCGKVESEDTPIINGLCPECFIKERYLIKLPHKFSITVCSGCGSLYIKGKWVYVGFDENEIIRYYISNALIKRDTVYPEATDVSIDEVNYAPDRTLVKVSAAVGGVRLSQELITEVVIRRRLCPRCIKIKTGSYEALIQIRYEGGNVDRELERKILNHLSRFGRLIESISEIKSVKDGLDIKVLNQGVARQVANIIKREFGAKITQSWEDAGYVSGKRHSKLTISLRLPALRRGDIIEVGNDLNVVDDVSKGRLVIRRLKDWKIIKLSYEELWSLGFRRLSLKDYSLVSGKILNYEGGKAVIQEVTSGAIYYVRLPLLKDLGSDVTLLIYKGKAYLLR